MLKFTRNSVIAFDFKDALSFEGETGPYIQYAVVRIRNIFRKGQHHARSGARRVRGQLPGRSRQTYLTGEANEDIWALWLRAGRRTMVLEQCIATSEPAYLAKHAFQLAQEFANFYHRHHILTEEDPRAKRSCSPRPPSLSANSSNLSPCSASKAPKRCRGSHPPRAFSPQLLKPPSPSNPLRMFRRSH
jgi:hypothetical protein